MTAPPPATLPYAPTWVPEGRAEWLDDGVRLRFRAGRARARVELFELLFGTATSATLAWLFLSRTWATPAGAGPGAGVRLFLSALGAFLLILAATGARHAYRHCRSGPAEDVFDRATRTFRCGMDHGRTLPFDDVSHLGLRPATAVLYAIEVHSRHAAKPLISRVYLARPAADTLVARAAEVVGVPYMLPARA